MKPSAMKQAAVLGLFLSAATSMTFAADWQAKLKSELPAMGHRNWIVVADAAYPKQSAPGIETVYTGGDQLDVLEKVLKAVEKASHVSAIVLLDAELDTGSATGGKSYKQLEDKVKNTKRKVSPCVPSRSLDFKKPDF